MSPFLLFALGSMCHFLTIAVPDKTVPEVPKEFRRIVHFAEHKNRSATEHAPSDWASFTVTSGGCSCNVYRASDDALIDQAKLKTKYRKKGWSEAKIQRALNGRRNMPARSAGLRADILDLIVDLTNRFEEIRLSLHWYEGDIETENFVFSDVGCVSLSDFRRNTTVLRDESTISIKSESGGNRKTA